MNWFMYHLSKNQTSMVVQYVSIWGKLVHFCDSQKKKKRQIHKYQLFKNVLDRLPCIFLFY